MRRKPESESVLRTGVLDDLARLWRRARAVLLAAPALLLVGFGAGHVTNGVLALPADAQVRYSPPRIEIEGLNRYIARVQAEGVNTADFVNIYHEQVAPVEHVLKRRGVDEGMARRMAWPLVEHSAGKKLDVATVLSVVFVESNGRPDATSSVGARGLMQVMPAWSGYWRECGRNLYDVEHNLCNGTNILAYYLRQHRGDHRRALLGYNGCVRGSVTPNCHTYPDKVDRLRRQIAAELAAARNEPRPGIAASR